MEGDPPSPPDTTMDESPPNSIHDRVDTLRPPPATPLPSPPARSQCSSALPPDTPFHAAPQENPQPTATKPTPSTPELNLALPCVQGWDAETVITNMDPHQVTLWHDILHPKILVYTWEGGYQPDTSQTAQRIQNAIANTLSVPEPDVGPPLTLTLPT
jgi:hypothetical protein